jgi:hypothetical protein
MRIDKTWHQCPAGEIDFAGASCRKIQDILVRPNRENSIACDGHSLGSRIGCVHRDDVRSVQNESRLQPASE